jgi:hypothetical protein
MYNESFFSPGNPCMHLVFKSMVGKATGLAEHMHGASGSSPFPDAFFIQ